MKKLISIALDGPAGAGKSTVAKILAENLGFVYFDTGALYRAMGYYFVAHGIDYRTPKLLIENLGKINIKFEFIKKEQHMFLCGEDITNKIRNNEISMAASNISAMPVAREFLLNTQRDVAKNNNVIMDGRDIGTVILPSATVKIFLTADVEVRAKRRFEQLKLNDPHVNYYDILDMIKERDKNDTERKISPLVPAKDAIIFDNTNINLNETVDRLAMLVRERINGKR